MSPAVYSPHPYQLEAQNWALEHPRCGLLLPMGSGKTVITLTVISELLYIDVARVLIIGPKRVIEHTWPAEVKKWKHTAWMTCQPIDGQTAKGKKPLPEADIILVSKENITDLIRTLGRDWPFDMVIVDELSTLKNPRSQRFRALRRVPSERFIGLTGTPAPNGIPDLWAQIYLIDGGQRLGRTLGEFRQTYLEPGRRNGYVVYDWRVKPGAKEAIYGKLSDICMSLTDPVKLPPVTMVTVPTPLPDMEAYRRFVKTMVLSETITAANAGVLTGKLSQLTSGEIYDQEDDGKTLVLHDAKLEALRSLYEAAQGNSMLVMYFYRHELERLTSAFPAARTLSGPEDIDDWNRGVIPMLLVHPASAGHGLNLQEGGHIIVWYTLPNWNLEYYEQANARLARQGQTNGVVIYHLIAPGTIDERQLEALQKKAVTQNDLMTALRKEIEKND